MNVIETFLGLFGISFFWRQALVILCLFLLGFVGMAVIFKRQGILKRLLMAYPLGLAVYALAGYVMLLVRIPFCAASFIIIYFLLMAAGAVLIVRQGKGQKITKLRQREAPEGGAHKQDAADDHYGKMPLIMAIFIVIAVALISCAGIFSVSVSNDSVYYYSTFPAILVHDEGYSASMDLFLTNVGQATAVINALPFLFGFDQSFGIQTALILNFIGIFALAARDFAMEQGLGKKGGMIAALLSAALLLSSESFLVISKWVLSNAYFMVYLFLAVLLGRTMGLDHSEGLGLGIIEGIFIGMLSMLRVEGGVVAAVLILSISLLNIDKKRMMLIFFLPLSLSQAAYFCMLFLTLGVNPLYSFMDWTKAVLMMGMLLMLAVYILFIRDRLPYKWTPLILCAAMLLGNGGLALINRGRYFTNLYAFYQNIKQQNGWGLMGAMLLLYGFLAVACAFRRRFKNIGFIDAAVFALALAIVAACWARGGVLAVRTSDSGNRALMQLTPLFIYGFYCHVIRLITPTSSPRPE